LFFNYGKKSGFYSGILLDFEEILRQRIYTKKADGDFDVHLVALSRSETLSGFARWSLRLLVDKVVELNYIENISHETIRRVLDKTKLNPRERRETG